MESMSECQEEFEKWTLRVNGKWGDKVLDKGPDGRYQILQTWNDWIAWQGAWEACKRLSPDWISVQERLPEDGEREGGLLVLCYRPNTRDKFSMESLHPINWEAEGLATGQPITHWKRLEAPE